MKVLNSAILFFYYFCAVALFIACNQEHRVVTEPVSTVSLGIEPNNEIRDSLLRRISGSWRWLQSRSNWGIEEIEKPAILERRMEIHGNEISFYENDSLVRKEKFALGFLANNPVLNFSPSGEAHSIWFNGTQFILGGEPFCACGCPENVYVRN